MAEALTTLRRTTTNKPVKTPIAATFSAGTILHSEIYTSCNSFHFQVLQASLKFYQDLANVQDVKLKEKLPLLLEIVVCQEHLVQNI